jgi:hypothetical protein
MDADENEIDETCSINCIQFHTYIDSLYPNELEINDITKCSKSASYLDILLKLDFKMNHVTQRANSILQKPPPLGHALTHSPHPPFRHALA